MQNATQPAAIVSEGEVLYHVDSVGVFERIATDSERVARLAADLLQNFPGDQADALRKAGRRRGGVGVAGADRPPTVVRWRTTWASSTALNNRRTASDRSGAPRWDQFRAAARPRRPRRRHRRQPRRRHRRPPLRIVKRGCVMPYRATFAPYPGLLFALSAIAAPPAESAPTTDQIYASFEDADYPKVLKQGAGALSVKGDAAAAYDRHELLVLKGETFVRQKNFAAAAEAFDAAARATIVETKAAVDRSTAELMRRSKAGVYTPAAGKAAPRRGRSTLPTPSRAGRRSSPCSTRRGPRWPPPWKRRRSRPRSRPCWRPSRCCATCALEMAAGGTDAESTAMARRWPTAPAR